LDDAVRLDLIYVAKNNYLNLFRLIISINILIKIWLGLKYYKLSITNQILRQNKIQK